MKNGIIDAWHYVCYRSPDCFVRGLQFIWIVQSVVSDLLCDNDSLMQVFWWGWVPNSAVK